VIDGTILLGGPRKRELALKSPLLVAAGALGMAPTRSEHPGLEYIGAVVTPPLTWAPISEADPPHLARTVAGYVLHTGRRNPGLRRAIRRYAEAWERLGVPVIAALYARYPADLAELAARASECECLQAFEIHLPHAVTADEAYEGARLAVGESAVPCLVRVPFELAVETARAVTEAGADALVIAAPPMGRAPSEAGGWVYGPLHSPALAPLFTERIHRVRAASDLPIIARGGIAESAHVLAHLAAGAVAVQLDSILMVRPSAAADLSRDLEAEMARRQAPDWSSFVRALAPEAAER
jgi:dihydroorotate dehydrogenase (NAD+) catalytic subunit